MPASVLLALLVATSLLALTPALVRRYDPDERMIADRAASDARVLAREAHRPDHPVPHDNPDESPAPQEPPVRREPRGWERRGRGRGESVRLDLDQSVTGEDPEMRETARLPQMRAEWWRRRHRRILYVLIALTLAELLGVIVAGPGFWIGTGVALAALGAYVYFLRARAKQLLKSKAAHPARAMLTAEPEPRPDDGPPTYVPEQTGADDDCDGAEEHRESFLFENGTLRDDEDEPPPPRPEARRSDSTGGVRGRSYESPAKLER
ncbi:hypothetical protein L0U85_14380 [Glycomyces sp. L485]|uniref:hypothetical protein n=1 Tax=Glycomyces sp. L485 TaxID=2909235 RepID=UPI001F4A2128|nr:hypothetical protein [Glycomyces sp. L485]MCH7232033.1 hypothetical protein [Glycomyces sp. L485]